MKSNVHTRCHKKTNPVSRQKEEKKKKNNPLIESVRQLVVAREAPQTGSVSSARAPQRRSALLLPPLQRHKGLALECNTWLGRGRWGWWWGCGVERLQDNTTVVRQSARRKTKSVAECPQNNVLYVPVQRARMTPPRVSSPPSSSSPSPPLQCLKGRAAAAAAWS